MIRMTNPDREQCRYVSTVPGETCAVTVSLTQQMLKCSVKSLTVSTEQVCLKSCSNKLSFLTIIVYLISTGATELSGSQFGTSSGPLFLSSLRCSDDHQSLLDDCTHTRLGLAACDDNSGLAGAKCFGMCFFWGGGGGGGVGFYIYVCMYTYILVFLSLQKLQYTRLDSVTNWSCCHP